jgi:hypothetical protein
VVDGKAASVVEVVKEDEVLEVGSAGTSPRPVDVVVDELVDVGSLTLVEDVVVAPESSDEDVVDVVEGSAISAAVDVVDGVESDDVVVVSATTSAGSADVVVAKVDELVVEASLASLKDVVVAAESSDEDVVEDVEGPVMSVEADVVDVMESKDVVEVGSALSGAISADVVVATNELEVEESLASLEEVVVVARPSDEDVVDVAEGSAISTVAEVVDDGESNDVVEVGSVMSTAESVEVVETNEVVVEELSASPEDVVVATESPDEVVVGAATSATADVVEVTESDVLVEESTESLALVVAEKSEVVLEVESEEVVLDRTSSKIGAAVVELVAVIELVEDNVVDAATSEAVVLVADVEELVEASS